MGLPCDPETVETARELLGPQHYEPRHVAATPWRELPALYARLDQGTAMHLALRIMILTIARSGAVLGMRFSEVEDDVWTVPADRMKAKKGKAEPFRIPLSPPALQILALARETAGGDLAFSADRGAHVSKRGTGYALDLLGGPGARTGSARASGPGSRTPTPAPARSRRRSWRTRSGARSSGAMRGAIFWSSAGS
jgi:integrase